MGFDEKARAENAHIDNNKAQVSVTAAELNLESAQNYATKYAKYNKAEATKNVYQKKAELRDAKTNAKAAEKELESAEVAFAATPIGKIENAAKKGFDFLTRVLGKKKK